LINPQDKLRQASDAKVQNDIGQLGTALQAYAAQQASGSYPCETAAGANCPNNVAAQAGLAALGPNGSNELQTVPVPPVNGGYGAAYGYDTAPEGNAVQNDALVSGQLRSSKYTSRTGCSLGTTYWMYNTTLGTACGFCGAAAPVTTDVCTFN
jgi:hypothetical protein